MPRGNGDIPHHRSPAFGGRRIGKAEERMVTTSQRSDAFRRRLFNRRFTRLTLGYSKKLDNHRHAVALFIAHFNFCREHSAFNPEKLTPAIAAGLTDHTWSVKELLTNEF